MSRPSTTGLVRTPAPRATLRLQVPTFTQSSDGASHFESPAVTDAEVLAGPVSLVDPEVLVDPVVLVGPEVLVGPVALLDAAALAAGVSAAFAAVKSRQAMAP